MIDKDSRIFISGIAGLVGQNLALRLSKAGYTNVCGVDKNRANLDVLNRMQPDVETACYDLADPIPAQNMIRDADVVIINQAQIGGLDYEQFVRNNVNATENILDAVDSSRDPYIVQISSSVVNSDADDFYTRSKTAQEDLVVTRGIRGVILRPTLMFGWFDRKHLGWLQRFMERTPIFPVPGHGRYRRQPLYVGDFCNVIIACMEQQIEDGTFDISGREVIDYIDIIRVIKARSSAKAAIVKIPYGLFFALIWMAGKLLRDPPFTVHQLRALIIPEIFDITDWPDRFGVTQTPFPDAVEETFNHPVYSDVVLEF